MWCLQKTISLKDLMSWCHCLKTMKTNIHDTQTEFVLLRVAGQIYKHITNMQDNNITLPSDTHQVVWPSRSADWPTLHQNPHP